MLESNDHSKWDDGGNSAKSGRNGPSVALIVALVVAAFVVVWFLRNGKHVDIDFVFGTRDTTVRWAIVIAIAIGVVLDRLVSYGWRRRKRRRSETE